MLCLRSNTHDWTFAARYNYNRTGYLVGVRCVVRASSLRKDWPDHDRPVPLFRSSLNCGLMVALLFCTAVKTIGVDFGVKQMKIPDTDCSVELFLFDCPGQGIFNKLEQARHSMVQCDDLATFTCVSLWFLDCWEV